MKNEEILQSKVIDFLRFPMIVGIVLLHAFLEGISGLNIPETGLPVYYFVSFLVSRVFAAVSVPLFFFISGYLFFYRTTFSFKVYLKKLKSRIYSLLIPYLFWNFLIFIAHWLISSFSTSTFTSSINISDFNLLDFFKCFWNIYGTIPINGVLWFIRDLIVMVLCSPLVYWVLYYCRWYILVPVGVFWILGTDSTIEIPRLATIFFFSLGAWFSINKRNFVSDFESWKFEGVLLYLLFAVGVVGVRGTDSLEYISHVSILMGIVSAIFIVTYFIKKGMWKASVFLTSSCFFIYASHQLPLNVLERILFKMIQPTDDWQFVLIYIMGPSMIILFELFAYKLLSRFFPRFVAFISGGRS